MQLLVLEFTICVLCYVESPLPSVICRSHSRRLPIARAQAVGIIALRNLVPDAKLALSDTLRDFIDLQECTSLRSLRYKHILLCASDAATTFLGPWVSEILSQIPSDSLEDIGFELMLPTSRDEGCLKELDWTGISTVLSRKEFRYLRSIQFSMTIGSAFMEQATFWTVCRDLNMRRGYRWPEYLKRSLIWI